MYRILHCVQARADGLRAELEDRHSDIRELREEIERLKRELAGASSHSKSTKELEEVRQLMEPTVALCFTFLFRLCVW